MLWSIVLFIAGLLILYGAAEALVRCSARLAISLGIRPLVVGMTIVAFATSMPEMMVSLAAAVRGSSDIAAGNIVGSNIANIGLILGLAACIQPLQVVRSTVWREIPFMVAVSLLLALFVLDGGLGFSDGLVLFLLLLGFVYYCVRSANAEPVSGKPPTPSVRQKVSGLHIFGIVLGICGLALGAEMMVRSAVVIAKTLGVSELVIGVTIIAVGTSLPELAASLVSAARGEMDISVGNVIGSNIFNLGFVLGICPMIRPLVVDPALLRFEIPVMLLFSVGVLPLVWRRHCLQRWHGALLLLGYLGFMGLVFIRSIG